MSDWNRQRRAELGARRDAELAVGVAQVVLDGREGDDELLGDRAVHRAGGGERRDAALAARQRAGAVGQPAARPRAGRAQLGERLLLECGGAAAVRQVDCGAERVTRLERPARASEGGTERGVYPCALDRRRGGAEGRDASRRRAISPGLEIPSMNSIGSSLRATGGVATAARTGASAVVRNAAPPVKLDVAALEQQVAELHPGALDAGLHP